MKLFNAILLFTIFLPLSFFAQEKEQINLRIVNPSSNLNLKNEWIKYGKGYSVTIDSLDSGMALLINKDDSSVYSSQDNCIVNYTIPKPFYGQELRIKGKLKLEGVDKGNVGLFMVVLGPKGTLSYEDMLNKEINGSRDWSTYESSVPYDSEKANEIRIGILHNGTGKVWAKDIELFLDDKPINEAKLKVFPASLDTEYDDLNSKIQFGSLSDFQLESLKNLGLIWGLLKYYHPNIAKGNFNLDYELFRILKYITRARTIQERDAMLSIWIDKFGNFKKHNSNKEKFINDKIKLKPDFSWVNEASFSKSLIIKLIDIVEAERTGINYYVELSQGKAKNPIFKNENSYEDLVYPDQGFQLLGLFRLWNIVQYYFPYRNLIDGDWKDVLGEFIPKITRAKTELDYKLVILELIGKISDSHAQIRSKEAVLDKFWGDNVPMPIFNFIEGKLVVTDFYEIEGEKEQNLRKGDIITKINGIPVQEVLKDKLKYSPGSNYAVQLRELAINIVRTYDSVLKVEYERFSKIHEGNLKTYPLNQKMVYSRFRSDANEPSLRLFNNEEVAYLNLGTLRTDSLSNIFNKIKNTKGLIIDVRNYPREFFPFSLGNYLLPEQTVFVMFSHPSIEEPGLFTLTEVLPVGRDNPDFYKGKVVILVNEQTQSAAEYTVMALSQVPNSVVIGSQTAGADGNVSHIFLPGGISTMISGIGVYYPNGDETQRLGLKIDMVVRPTINGIINNIDEPLTEAINIIKNL